MDMGYLCPLIEAAEAVIAEKGRAVIAIDGMAAAGKTTAAAFLSDLWGAPVVHMDDFFLPLPLRAPERLSEPGGNVHYERFAQEVLPGLISGEAFSYRLFRCSVMDFDGEAKIAAAPIVIVEGAYAMHPRFGDYADVTAFFSVPPEEQKRRILARNGPEKWPDFRDRWIPMENAYHAAFDTRARAGIVL